MTQLIVVHFDETMNHLIGQEITVIENKTVDPRDKMQKYCVVIMNNLVRTVEHCDLG